jgi:hypothetical protein
MGAQKFIRLIRRLGWDPQTPMTISTIANTVTSEVFAGNATYATSLTIAATGGIVVGGTNSTALINQNLSPTFINYGVITAGSIGVEANNVAGTLFNNAHITGGAKGVYFNTGGSVSNTGTIIGTSAYGVQIKNGSFGWLDNSGIVTGGKIGFYGADTGTVINTGSITGSLTAVSLKNGGTVDNIGGYIGGGSIGIYINTGGTVTNSGTIEGSTDAIDAHNSSILVIDPGAVFIGAVVNSNNNETIILGGTTPGTLDMGNSFSGVSHISFATGSTWTLEGSTLALANPTNKETITGFAAGDQIALDGFSVTSETYVSGRGLELGNGTVEETIDLVGSFTTGSFEFNTVNGQVYVEALCYLRGTHILTPSGEVPIEILSPGDLVVTRFGGVQPIKWIGGQSYDPRFVARNPEKLPVRIAAGALGAGLPVRDLAISPGHSMLLDQKFVLARNLVNGVTIRQEPAATQIDYFQIELETHDCVLAEGAWSETFADAPGLRAQFHNAANFWALYPDYETPPALALAAPRPQAGPELEAALRPIVARAAASVTPGRLEGYIDVLTSETIAGWARDAGHPNLPVELEFFLGAISLGTALACDPRPDLAQAGLGNCAFAVTLSTKLAPEDLARLQIRRTQDGAMLPAAETLRRTA